MKNFYGTKSFKLVVAAVILVLLACIVYLNINKENKQSAQSASTSQNSSSKTKKLSNEEIENGYIKSVHESAVKINTDTDQLKTLLLSINVDDSTWHSDVSIEIRDIDSAISNYENNEILLSTISSKNKYEKTIGIFDKGIEQYKSIVSNSESALDTYDTKKFEDVAAKLDPANESIQKGLQQLEIDRYKK